MGEIAEMMIEGVLCEGCGVYLGGGEGFPVRCSACRTSEDEEIGRKPEKVECPICKKRVSPLGVSDHLRDVHGKRLGLK